MNLLASLNAGLAGAANGTAEIYVRGTATRAVWYPDFEASTSDSSGADIILDAYGAAEVYVNQLVDVVVKSSDGTIIRSFTDGYASGNVEVISPAFTGVDYVTGMSGVSKPTTLQSVLDLWQTNAGAPDWKVLISGTATTLLNALGALNGVLFNVKSPQFGAIGNGVTNDQAAIQAALAAAVAAGGGTVYLPPGTYLVSTAIDWNRDVHLVGAGSGVTTIITNSAVNARILTWTSGAGRVLPACVHGISFTASVTNSGDQIYSNVTSNVSFSDCYFNVSTNCTGSGINFAGASCVLSVRNCRLNAHANIQTLWFSDSANVWIEDTRFVAVNSAFDHSLLRTGTGGRVLVRGCLFDADDISSAPSSLYGIEQLGASLSVVGCVFRVNTHQFTAQVKALSGTVVARGNVFASGTRYEVSTVLGTASDLELTGSSRQTGSGATYTVPDGVAVHTIVSTGTTPSVTLPTKLFPGQRLYLITQNNSGGNWGSITLGPYLGLASVVSFNPLATTGAAFEFVVTDVTTAGTYAWTLVGGA